MRISVTAAFLLLLLSFALSAQERIPSDENGDGVPDTWTVFEDARRSAVLYDSDFDGEIDFSLHYNRDGELSEQRQDFNCDGSMDDYYFFVNEVLVRREIDSNYDGEIDVKVYLDKGIYITRYEQDVDFDGTFDKIKEFGPK